MLAKGPNQQLRGLRSLGYLAMHEGRFVAAADDLQQAVVIAHAQMLPLSEARTRLVHSLALEALGRAAEGRVERDSTFAVARTKYLPPTMLTWLGTAAARAGELPRARSLLDSVRRRGDPKSDDDRGAAEVLAAEIASIVGRHDEAAGRLATAYSLDSSSFVLDAEARAAARRGDLREAERLYAALAARQDFGWEGELPRLLAPAERARVLERLGDAAGARASWERLVERWPAGDAALLPLAEARRRLGMTTPVPRR
jgi:tetratricopeptide (TPR) repeat protein